MKTERRHDLETNEISKRLDKLVQRVGPHSTTLTTVAIVVVLLVAAAMYMQKSVAARQDQAWDAYNMAIEGGTPDLDLLKQSAEEHAGTDMAEWANAAWADGHVMRATRLFINNRALANDGMNKAEGAYQSLLRTSTDPQIKDRAHLGLARIYEMRNELAKAREHYLAVTGAFAKLAKERAEALEKEPVIEAWDWLATAQAPLRAQPSGPGSPGVKPEFDVDELAFPEDEDVTGPDFGTLLESFGRTTEEQGDRYEVEGSAGDAETSDEPAGNLTKESAEDAVENEANDDSESP